MFISKQIGTYNKDLDFGKDLNYYLKKAAGFKSTFNDFEVIEVNGRFIIDESTSCPVGYKARSGEMLVKSLADAGVKEIVYVQPRQGFAGISLSYLCERYQLNLTLVMPSSKEISPHQLLCIEYGAKPLFVRIAAMPNANRIAKMYAEKNGAVFIPLGLYHEDVIACGVKQIHEFFLGKPKPKVMWSAFSTGVLSRTLQIALPTTDFVAVAVARNVQHGELGKAEFMSYHKEFYAKSDYVPLEFDTEQNYDAKAYHYFIENSNESDWFFNVAGNAPISRLNPKTINSYRDWNDLSDFNF